MKRLALIAAATVVVAVVATRIVSAPKSPLPAPDPNGRAVVQLFTSQGCSSCPPAEKLLSTISREGSPAVIPLAYHVDYWNYIGWSDPFSSAQWSNQQRAYSAALKAEVYTPQLIVNGRKVMVGSSTDAVRNAIAAALAEPADAAVSVSAVRRGSALHIESSARGSRELARRGAHVVLAVFEDGARTNVLRGENSGRTLESDRIVRWQSNDTRLDDSGAASTVIDVPVATRWNAAHLGVAAFVQEDRSLAIHGGAYAAVR